MLARTLPVRGARGKQVVVVYIGFGAPLVLFWFILLKEEVRTYLLDFYVSPGFLLLPFIMFAVVFYYS